MKSKPKSPITDSLDMARAACDECPAAHDGVGSFACLECAAAAIRKARAEGYEAAIAEAVRRAREEAYAEAIGHAVEVCAEAKEERIGASRIGDRIGALLTARRKAS